jgi:hypothetical protein
MKYYNVIVVHCIESTCVCNRRSNEIIHPASTSASQTCDLYFVLVLVAESEELGIGYWVDCWLLIAALQVQVLIVVIQECHSYSSNHDESAIGLH